MLVGAGPGAREDCVTAGADVTGCADFLVDDSVVTDLGAVGVRRGVGKSIGVTATTIAVRSSAIKSLLSIYGTGS